MSIPLTKIKEDGSLYQRRPKVEALINKILEESLSNFLDNKKISIINSSDYIPSEVILYFFRHSNKDSRNFKLLFDVLVTRVSSTIKNETIIASDSRHDANAKFVELLAEDINVGNNKLDYFEVRFNSALQALYIDSLRAIKTKNAGCEEVDDIQFSLESDKKSQNFFEESSLFDDPSFRFQLYTAINSLPQDQKEVIALTLKGYQVEAKEKNTITISSLLNCTERTVRNRRLRAYKALKDILKLDQESE